MVSSAGRRGAMIGIPCWPPPVPLDGSTVSIACSASPKRG